VLITGGSIGLGYDDTYLTNAEINDSSTGTFGPLISFATKDGMYVVGRGWQTTTLIANGEVLMAGGFGWDGNQGPLGTLSSAELFDPTSNSFSTTGSMAIPRQNHVTAALSDGEILVAGGWDGNHVRGETELYTPPLR
jgi:hypothetical protein